MPRTNLTAQVLPAPYSATPYAVLTFVAGDAANGNHYSMNGDQLLIAKNTGVAARTITITSAADPYGRTKDVTALSIAAGATVMFSKFNTPGWRQTDGKVWIAVEHAEVTICIVDLANNRSFS